MVNLSSHLSSIYFAQLWCKMMFNPLLKKALMGIRSCLVSTNSFLQLLITGPWPKSSKRWCFQKFFFFKCYLFFLPSFSQKVFSTAFNYPQQSTIIHYIVSFWNSQLFNDYFSHRVFSQVERSWSWLWFPF